MMSFLAHPRQIASSGTRVTAYGGDDGGGEPFGAGDGQQRVVVLLLAAGLALLRSSSLSRPVSFTHSSSGDDRIPTRGLQVEHAQTLIYCSPIHWVAMTPVDGRLLGFGSGGGRKNTICR